MKSAVGLMYHDTFVDGDTGSSGRSGVGPDLYKVDVECFRQQIEGLQRRYEARLQNVLEADPDSCPLFITFDDGGVSARTQAAEVLEQFGIVGHFFVTSSYIDTPGFLTEEQIRELDQRGHVIGSHSHTHPDIITDLGDTELLREWKVSTDRLQQILGKPIESASIPGGEYSDRVARAANEVGIRYLFTSEPQKRTWKVDDCLAIGRYMILQTTSADVVFELGSDASTRGQRQQWRSWYSKKLIKRICGPFYLVIRERLLSARRQK